MTKKRLNFKREYFPVIIGLIIFIALCISLWLLINMDKKESGNVIPDTAVNETEDLIVKYDTALCGKEATNAAEITMSYKSKYTKIGEGYSQDTDEKEDVMDYVLELTIDKLSDDLYAKIESSRAKPFTIDKSKIKNGKYTFDILDNQKVTKYTVSVYGNSEKCKDKMVRQFEIETPKRNQMSGLGICQDRKEMEECAVWTMNENININTIKEYAERYDKTSTTKRGETTKPSPETMAKYYYYQEHDKKEFEKLHKEIYGDTEKEKNTKTIIIVAISIVIVIGIIVIIIKSKRGRKNESKQS